MGCVRIKFGDKQLDVPLDAKRITGQAANLFFLQNMQDRDGRPYFISEYGAH